MPMDWDTANDKHIGPTLNRIERYLNERWKKYVDSARPGWESSVRLDGVYPGIGYKVWFNAHPRGGYGVQIQRSLHLSEYPHGLPDSNDPAAHVRYYQKMWARVKARKWETEWKKELPKASESNLRGE